MMRGLLKAAKDRYFLTANSGNLVKLGNRSTQCNDFVED